MLQLNFTHAEINNFYKLIFPNKRDDDSWNPFHSYGHPAELFTMAWARLDLDFTTGEVLVEEIQNDYLREVRDVYKRLQNLEVKKEKDRLKNYWIFDYGGGTYDSFQKYFQSIKHLLKIWDEAMLSAVIWFVKEELGMDKLYYHTYESGRIFKRFKQGYSLPPKSLYTKLPSRFGFDQTGEAPQFLQKVHYLKKMFTKNNDLRWFVIQL